MTEVIRTGRRRLKSPPNQELNERRCIPRRLVRQRMCRNQCHSVKCNCAFRLAIFVFILGSKEGCWKPLWRSWLALGTSLGTPLLSTNQRQQPHTITAAHAARHTFGHGRSIGMMTARLDCRHRRRRLRRRLYWDSPWPCARSSRTSSRSSRRLLQSRRRHHRTRRRRHSCCRHSCTSAHQPISAPFPVPSFTCRTLKIPSVCLCDAW